MAGKRTISGFPSYGYATISTGATTTVKTGSGHLARLIITGGTAGTIDVYDNTAGSGTKIAAFSSTNSPMTAAFECAFDTGLTIVTSAATNITVCYA